MNRSDFQHLTTVRLREAKVLLDNGCYEGAYYLAGYAVECALKACISKKTNQYDFPDKDLAFQAYTHNLKDLVKLAGLEQERNNQETLFHEFKLNWSAVKDWSEHCRYMISVSDTLATTLYLAIIDDKNGVLTWLKKYW
ncbi:MAG: HEPN domain-containing protein [Armatimonadetes bacterium]|nr:HEPN domain-containing protein [Armatimonadota bacterium]